MVFSEEAMGRDKRGRSRSVKKITAVNFGGKLDLR
jgi:hypothetical protein